MMKTWISDGYEYVTLRLNHKKRSFRVHRLVAEAFVPNPNNLPEVNHIDGNKTNNKSTNLEWCSHRDNIEHALNTGLIKIGEDNSNAKLTKDDVVFIRRYYKKGDKNLGAMALAKKFKVSRKTIKNVIEQKRYKNRN